MISLVNYVAIINLSYTNVYNVCTYRVAVDFTAESYLTHSLHVLKALM